MPLIKTQNNTGLLGLLVCINSLTNLYNNLVEPDIVTFLLTYKFSQDHVEFFLVTYAVKVDTIIIPTQGNLKPENWAPNSLEIVYQ